MNERLVLVRWYDAWQDDHLEPVPESWKSEFINKTVGWLVRDGDVVSIASEKLPTGDYRAVTHIPCQLVIDKIDLQAVPNFIPTIYIENDINPYAGFSSQKKRKHGK